jgi:hypothetical protein
LLAEKRDQGLSKPSIIRIESILFLELTKFLCFALFFIVSTVAIKHLFDPQLAFDALSDILGKNLWEHSSEFSLI